MSASSSIVLIVIIISPHIAVVSGSAEVPPVLHVQWLPSGRASVAAAATPLMTSQNPSTTSNTSVSTRSMSWVRGGIRRVAGEELPRAAPRPARPARPAGGEASRTQEEVGVNRAALGLVEASGTPRQGWGKRQTQMTRRKEKADPSPPFAKGRRPGSG